MIMSIPAEPTKVTFVAQLPVELWLRVFRFATSTPISLSTHYEPFQSSHDNTTLSDAALRDKYNLALVCKQWRLLAADMLYEDIRIGRGISALYAALGQPIPSGLRGPRHRVRRVILPYACTATPSRHAPPALALLALLPHLEVLVRPPMHRHAPALPFEFPTPAPALPTLRRLEWAFDTTGAAARAGGINALADVLRAAPAIEELVLVGLMPFTALHQARLRLGCLRTLRLLGGAGTDPLVARQVAYWALPALENVVVVMEEEEDPRAAEALEALWEAFGDQVRVLEIGDCVPTHEVQWIVGSCAALEELNLRVSGSVAAQSWERDGAVTWGQYMHHTLRRVGLCVGGAGEWDVGMWVAVGECVGRFGEGCPALCEVVLYARDVRVAAQSPQFHALRETLSSSGRQLLLRSLHA